MPLLSRTCLLRQRPSGLLGQSQAKIGTFRGRVMDAEGGTEPSTLLCSNSLRDSEVLAVFWAFFLS